VLVDGKSVELFICTVSVHVLIHSFARLVKYGFDKEDISVVDNVAYDPNLFGE